MIKISFEAGTEKWLRWIQDKARVLRSPTSLSGLEYMTRAFAPEDGTLIWMKLGPYGDFARVTGAPGFGRFVWGRGDADAARKFAFKVAGDNATILESHIVTGHAADWAYDFSTFVDIDTTAHTATLTREGVEVVITDATTLYSATDCIDQTAWYKNRHCAMSNDGKRVILRSTDDMYLLVVATWNADTLTFDETRVGPPDAVQSFMDGASNTIWSAPWFSGAITNTYVAAWSNYGSPDVVLSGDARYWVNPYKAEVWVEFDLRYVNSRVVIASAADTGPPGDSDETLSRISGNRRYGMYKYDALTGLWETGYMFPDQDVSINYMDRINGDVGPAGNLIGLSPFTTESFAVFPPGESGYRVDYNLSLPSNLAVYGAVLWGSNGLSVTIYHDVAGTPNPNLLKNYAAWITNADAAATLSAINPGTSDTVLIRLLNGTYSTRWKYEADTAAIVAPDGVMSKNGQQLVTGAAPDQSVYVAGSLTTTTGSKPVGAITRAAYGFGARFESSDYYLWKHTENADHTWSWTQTAGPINAHWVWPGTIVTPAAPATTQEMADALGVVFGYVDAADMSSATGISEAVILAAMQALLDDGSGAAAFYSLMDAIFMFLSGTATHQDMLDFFGATEADFAAAVIAEAEYLLSLGTPAVYGGDFDFTTTDYVPVGYAPAGL